MNEKFQVIPDKQIATLAELIDTTTILAGKGDLNQIVWSNKAHLPSAIMLKLIYHSSGLYYVCFAESAFGRASHEEMLESLTTIGKQVDATIGYGGVNYKSYLGNSDRIRYVSPTKEGILIQPGPNNPGLRQFLTNNGFVETNDPETWNIVHS